MLDKLRSAARVIDEKIGWHRIGLALSVTIIVAAAVVLYRMLHNIAIDEVVAALRNTPGIRSRSQPLSSPPAM